MAILTSDTTPFDTSLLVTTPIGSRPSREARETTSMHGPESPASLCVMQITQDKRYASSHIYMESQVFTPDCRRFVFQRGTREPTTINMGLRRRQYWLCDMDDDFALHPLTDETWVSGPAVSHDGEWCYYFVNKLDPRDRDVVELRRVSLSTFRRETVARLDTPTDGAPAPPCRLYGLSSIRADGGAIVTGAFFGDGVDPAGIHGLLVIDLNTGAASAPLLGKNMFNPHPQYYRGTSPKHRHDILVQENFCDGATVLGDPIGVRSGCVLHVVRDDGSDFRTVPCGHDLERCHGHQEWRGGTDEVLVGVDWLTADKQLDCRPIVLARAVPNTPDSGIAPVDLPNAAENRRVLMDSHPEPCFAHTAFDASGTRFATDWWNVRSPNWTARLHVGTLPKTPDAALTMRFLLYPRTGWENDQFTHPHPCLSPDGSVLLFNSTQGDGSPQIFLATGFDYP